MSVLTDLVNQIDDIALRERIQKEVNKLAKQKKFGLVFEEHMPECTPLYDMPIKVGTTVAKRACSVNDIYKVLRIKDGVATCVHKESQETCTIDIAELVAVAEFGESIYPYLKPLDAVCNAPDSDLWHTLIEADNYHALQLLEYLYAGKVDCIYIDPPYNTGAKDWKYNNDYVDGNDTYRHSKWLSFMEKRLKLARKLLNPKDSVMIITIDEKEYLHLGCLLEEMFPEARIQMVSDVINRTGSIRQDLFARADEYIYFVLFGSASAQFNQNDMLNPYVPKKGEYQHLIRGGANGLREKRPNLFYPIFFRKNDGTFHSIGPALELSTDRNSVVPPDGCFAVWPLTKNGIECRWGISTDSFLQKYEKGYISFGKWTPGSENRWIGFLQSGTEQAVEEGLIEVLGRDEEGSLILGNSLKPTRAMTVWNQVSHDAGTYGSSLLNHIFLDRRFNYPKSIYSTHDAIRFFVDKKPSAIVVDFFAGSGTTMHAVNLLNAKDGGKRRCILITNNEVSTDEAKSLAAKGHRPGDPEWEDLGIARHVTWPRTVCTIKGHDVTGAPLKGTYLDCDIPMSDGFPVNAAFFKLGFLDSTAIALGMAFDQMLPTLWMKAGAIGQCPTTTGISIPNMLVLPENKFAVLVNENAFSSFAEELTKHPEIQTVFLATDYDINYRSMVKNLNVQNTYQLYRDYLDHFRLNRGRS